MKTILILAFSDLRHDSRVLRQIHFLKDHYKLTVACFDAPESAGIEMIPVKRVKPGVFQKLIGGLSLLIHAYDYAYRLIYEDDQLVKTLNKRSFDLIIGNDIESLPLAFRLRKQAKVLFDAHEYAPRHFEDKLIWRIFFQNFNIYLCKKYLPQTHAMTTVGWGLAEKYTTHFNVQPIVLTNANYYSDLTPQAPRQTIRLIHHGGANPSRKLELMIEMMDYLDERFTLDLILITPSIANKTTKAYLDRLRLLVKKNPRVKILPPVKPHEVVETIHAYDIGVFLIPPINFNYKNTLPNKFFDFIQARLAIAIGPTPEMVRLVNQYDLGVVAEDFTARGLAEKINTLTADQIYYYKKQSHMAATKLNAEENKKILSDLVQKLLA